ncbi:MAG: V4R domain-containing protein [Halobacteriota archaeon]|nr:V4R domain-containing protein [Halobacteriota archaeon]
MAKTDLNKNIFDVYGEYAIYHPDLIIVNRKVSSSIIGSISKTVDYNIGKRIGKIVAEECKKLFKNNPLDASFEIIEYSGWGQIKIDRSENVVKVRNSLVSRYYLKHEGASNDTIDDIMSGIISAIFEEIEGKECKVTETKCIAKGDEYCEFTLSFGNLNE